jgi:hypothetical protein
VVFWVMAPCRVVGGYHVSEEYTDFVLRLEVRQVGKRMGGQCGNGLDV